MKAQKDMGRDVKVKHTPKEEQKQTLRGVCEGGCDRGSGSIQEAHGGEYNRPN